MSIRLNEAVTMTFTAQKPGFVVDVVNSTISAEAGRHFIGISLSPSLVEGKHHMRLVMNWGIGPMDLDIHALQIDK